MFVVIFEVQPKPGRLEEYLTLARYLKPKLEATEGFIDNERFTSLSTKGLLLSVSTWRDEKSIIRWRTEGAHHAAQAKGRAEIIEDYHLRVGEVTADTDFTGGALPQQRFDVTEKAAAKVASLSEFAPNALPPLGVPSFPAETDGLFAQELFESIITPGKLLRLASWRDLELAAAALALPQQPAGGQPRHRLVRVIRDYGLSDRYEAPQFYPERGKPA